MGIQVRTRARSLGAVPMARQCVARDAKVLGGPRERESGSVKLGFRDDFFVEISFAEDRSMSQGTVGAGRLRRCAHPTPGLDGSLDVASGSFRFKPVTCSYSGGRRGA
jgi:hypothetical protein